MLRKNLTLIISIVSRVCVLMMIAASAFWPTLLNLKKAYNNSRLVGLSHGPAWEEFYLVNDSINSFLGGEGLLQKYFIGGGGSQTMFGVTFVDPAAGLAALSQSSTFSFSLVLGLVVVFALALFSGRTYCAYGCPASLFFSLGMRLREKFEISFPFLKRSRRAFPGWLRISVFVGGVVATGVSGAWVWQLLLPYVSAVVGIKSLIAGTFAGSIGLFFLFILAFDFAIAPGEICRSFCPTGLLLGLAGNRSVVTITAKPTPCLQDCTTCSDACDLRIDPIAGVSGECSLCGRCIRKCPAEKLSIGLRKKTTDSKHEAKAFSIAALFASALLFPAIAAAHHYKGLPHYGYYDNYPQVPTDEYITSEGRWEVNFTMYNFQGMTEEVVDAPSDVQIFLIIYDLKSGKPFGGKARIEILSENNSLESWELEPEQEALYWISTNIPDNSGLALKTTFTDPDGKPIVIESKFSLPGEGGPGAYKWLGLLILGMTGLLFAVSKKDSAKNGSADDDVQ